MIAINEKDKEIKVPVILTNSTGKIRIKKRSSLNEYGETVPTRRERFSNDCYVEWQIGYDVAVKSKKKIKETTLQSEKFTGANGKEKALYELSEYIKYFYDWGVISENILRDMKNYLSTLSKEDYLDDNPDLKIKRNELSDKIINGFNFECTEVKYPLLIHKFNNSNLIVEIKITEKQKAVGTQPMLYLCFPITELENGASLIGRTANAKESANFVINENNISVFLEILNLFGILSENHNKDTVSIIDTVLK